MNGDSNIFDFKMNPYECLGVPDFCSDFDVIKSAYKQKNVYLNPENTNGFTKYEFSNLNKSYLYLKMKLKNSPSLRQTALELDLEQRLNERKQGTIPLSRATSSVLETNKFDHDAAFQEMMQFRPTNARYSSTVPTLQPGVGENYMKNVNPWGGSDNESATIIGNSQIMFVQQDSSLDQYALVNDIPTRQYDGPVSSKVNRNEVNSFMRMYHDVQNVPKISNGSFDQKMKDMERDFGKKLTMEAIEKEEYLKSILK